MNRCLWIIVALIAQGPGLLAAQEPSSDDARLKSLLTRLNLTDLQVRLLEDELADVTNASQRIKIGNDLADLYALELTRTANDPARHDELLNRVQRLLAVVPQANTPSLQTMLLQADHVVAEAKVLEWFEDRSNELLRDEARAIFERLSVQFQEQIRAIESQELVDSERILKTEDPEMVARIEASADQLQVVRLRATYFSGWTHFFLAICVDDANQRDDALQQARNDFASFLELDLEEDLSEVDPEWLGLESSLRARAMLGFGLVAMGLNDDKAARQCFSMLDDYRVAQDVRDEYPYWYIQGTVSFNMLEEAYAFARRQIATIGSSPTNGKSRFCVTLVRQGYGPASAGVPLADRLGELGLEGLARTRQFKLALDLLDRMNIEVPATDNFYLLWIRGFQAYQAAEATKLAADFKAAADLLRSALALPEAGKDLTSAGHCRYQYAWSLFQGGEHERAANEFQLVIPTLKQFAPDIAVNAAWMRFQAYQKLASTQPRFSILAIEALEDLKRNFPDSSYAKNADYLMVRLRRTNHSTIETIKELEKVRRGTPNYQTVLYELCLMKHQYWVEQSKAGKPTDSIRADLIQAVDRYLLEAKSESSQTRKLKATLLVVDVALRSNPKDLATATRYLDRGKTMFDRLPASDPIAVEYQYQRFQIARLQNKPAAMQQLAQWLADNADGSIYQKSAWILLAQQADKAVASADQTNLRSRQQAARDAYRRLVSTTGDSPAQIQADKNARVTISKLADYEYLLGNYAEAAAWSEKLVAAFPRNTAFLRLAGLSNYELGRYPEALDQWRLLTRGLAEGSGRWYEAKYYVIASLLKTNQDEALKVYRQFRLLHPSIDISPWEERFSELSNRIEG